jgi:ADP-ribosylglycohydrolase
VNGAADRARGALLGLALGDALGMPTQGLDFGVVQERYGVLDGFHAAPPDNPISAGLPAGRVTDDTDQAVLVAELLVAGAGRADPLALAGALAAWEARMRAAGSLDLLGPSTRAALDRLAAGIGPDRSGLGGATNGAAMRIAPVGIVCDLPTPIGPAGLGRLVGRVVEVSRPTHNTGLAIAGAAAVAAAVSAGIAGLGLVEALRVAGAAAAQAADAGPAPFGDGLAERIGAAVDLVAGCPVGEAIRRVSDGVGTGLATEESVPAALAFASLMVDQDAWLVVRAAASVGGDSDTIAAMAGAVCGAVAGAGAFPAEAVQALLAANPSLRLAALADQLFALRGNDSGVDG